MKWVDTVTSVLDLLGIGGLARSINKGAKAADALSNASREAARSGVQPASLSQRGLAAGQYQFRAAAHAGAKVGRDRGAGQACQRIVESCEHPPSPPSN